MTRRWKIGAALLGAFGLALITATTRKANPVAAAAAYAVAAAPAQTAHATPSEVPRPPARMTAHDMAQTIGGDWLTELVQVVGAAITGYDSTSTIGWYCGLVSC